MGIEGRFFRQVFKKHLTSLAPEKEYVEPLDTARGPWHASQETFTCLPVFFSSKTSVSQPSQTSCPKSGMGRALPEARGGVPYHLQKSSQSRHRRNIRDSDKGEGHLSLKLCFVHHPKAMR
jgi:hypothetical protein